MIYVHLTRGAAGARVIRLRGVGIPSENAAGEPKAGTEGRAGKHKLWRLWRSATDDPAPFYRELAARAVLDLERWFGPLDGQRIADIGCGPGWYTTAMRRAGADVIPIDSDQDELDSAGPAPAGAIVGNAMNLPVEHGSVDGVFASNMLEHTPHPERVIAEVARILRPGGWAYLSWTNWFSPWGGHDMTPFHLVGPRLGLYLYRRRHGHAPKCVYGVSLWPVHIGTTLKMIRAEPGIHIISVEPRYWPSLRVIVDIPIVREVATWNCVVRMRKWSA